jgi:hypothetical protein
MLKKDDVDDKFYDKFREDLKKDFNHEYKHWRGQGCKVEEALHHADESCTYYIDEVHDECYEEILKRHKKTKI